MGSNNDKFSPQAIYASYIHSMLVAIVEGSDHEELIDRNQSAVNAMLSGIACILSYLTDEVDNKNAVEDVVRVLREKAEYCRKDFVQALESGKFAGEFPEEAHRNIH